MSSRGGVIAGLAAGSPAARVDLLVGDTVVSANGAILRDVLDWQWETDGGSVDLVVVRDGEARELTLARDPGEAWGIDFADVVFDAVRTCRNNCAFCFMAQLPEGMRPSLSLRDDDYRLSFMNGNFITLTNFTDADVDRIAEMRLSPLYVSLHAVEDDVRRRLVCAKTDQTLERFDQLVEAGIDLHVQIVLVPGENDGDHLDRTLAWLSEREGVISVGIVPVGYTRHQERITASFTDQLAAATVIQQVQRWQFESRDRDGVTWVHLADEFYLNARAPFPTTDWYDDFPQYENGIGIVRTFVDEAMALREELTKTVCRLPEAGESATVVTGMMAATTLAGALNACDAAGYARLLAVPNRFFGGNVSVTGLLTGQDIADAIASDRERFGSPSAYLIPDIVFNDDGLTLDDLTFEDMVARSGADLRLVSSDAAGLLAGLTDVADHPASE